MDHPTSSPTFSIVLPSHNEEENLRILIPKIIEGFAGHAIEIVLVDDGSTDGTREVFQSFSPLVPEQLVSRGRLMGLGSALRDGYNAGRGKYLISFDCDLSIRIDDALAIARTLLSDNYDLVLGSRYLPGSFYQSTTPQIAKKKKVSKYGNIFLRHVNGIKITDFTFNCRGLKKSSWSRIRPESDNNFLLTEMVWRAHHLNMQITEVPVHFYDRQFGESKLVLSSETKKYLAQLFKLRLRYLFSKPV